MSERYPVSIKAVLRRGREVCLLVNHRGEWELPGGRLEAGESPESCLAREIREEVGGEIEVGSLLHAWLFEVLPGQRVFVVAYAASWLGGVPAPSDEHRSLDWFGLDALPPGIPEGYMEAIRRAKVARSLIDNRTEEWRWHG